MPKGWTPSASGTIYFRPTNTQDKKIVRALTISPEHPKGKESVRLGASTDEAASNPVWLRILAERKRDVAIVPGCVSEIIARARQDYLPKVKNEETRAWRAGHVDEIERRWTHLRYARNVFDATKAPPGTVLTAMDVQRAIDEDAETRPAAVNRMTQTGRLVWKEARRRWGLTEYNPFEGLDENDESSRETLPDDRAHFFPAYRKASPPLRFILALGRYYGRRPGEARSIEVTGIDAAGVHTVRGKRRRELILEWDDVVIGQAPDGSPITRPGRLRKMVARALRWREQVIRPTRAWKNGKRRAAPAVVATTLLVNSRGRAITKSGYQTEFRRVMVELGLVEVLGEAIVAGRKVMRTRRAFNPNDTRAARATTLPKGHRSEVLAHEVDSTTERIYVRGPIRIRVKEGS